MERTKEALFCEHCTTQHALRGARHQIYDSSRGGKEKRRRQRTIRKKNRSIFRDVRENARLCNAFGKIGGETEKEE